MKWKIQHILATAILAATGAAQAATVTSQAWDLQIAGSATLSFSADLLGALDTGKMSIASYGYAFTPVVHKDTDGFYTEVQAVAPISTLTYDNVSNALLGMGSVGGVTLTAPTLKSVSSGGQVTVTDLNADLSTKTIYATVIGGNGLGTLAHLALWRFSGITGNTSVQDTDIWNTVTGLSLTPEGFNAFSQSLGLLNLGKSALMGVTDFGTITVVTNHMLMDGDNLTPPPWYVGQVPEPSSYALMGLGLVGLTLVKRRQAR